MTTTNMRAHGSFEVKVLPQTQTGPAEEGAIGRMSIDKQFDGGIEGTSKGEMLTARTEANSAAAYVALERVTATIGGRSGTFALMHLGTMASGAFQLAVTVAPGSGTDELAGIDGSMTISIVGKEHTYSFDYTLPASS